LGFSRGNSSNNGRAALLRPKFGTTGSSFLPMCADRTKSADALLAERLHAEAVEAYGDATCRRQGVFERRKSVAPVSIVIYRLGGLPE
jgi:hypothetical protein